MFGRSIEEGAGLSPWARWRVQVSARRGRAVRDAAHAPYAIAFAEREIDRQPVTGAVLVAAGVLLMLAGVLLGYGWMFAAGGGPIGAGVSSFASPKRMQRSIDANRRLELTRTSVGR